VETSVLEINIAVEVKVKAAIEVRASVGFAVYRIDPNRTENPYGSYLILKP
jgi:hypothetical protein